jgi:hypothetical protein
VSEEKSVTTEQQDEQDVFPAETTEAQLPVASKAPPVDILIYTDVKYVQHRHKEFEAIESDFNGEIVVKFKRLPGDLMRQTLMEIAQSGVLAYSHDQLLVIPAHRVTSVNVMKSTEA